MLSEKTVRNHVERTYNKIGVSNRIGATCMPSNTGWRSRVRDEAYAPCGGDLLAAEGRTMNRYPAVVRHVQLQPVLSIFLPDRVRRRLVPEVSTTPSPLPRAGRAHRCSTGDTFRAAAQCHGTAGVQGGWTRIVPKPIEWSTYVLAASLVSSRRIGSGARNRVFVQEMTWSPARLVSVDAVRTGAGRRCWRHIHDQSLRVVRAEAGFRGVEVAAADKTGFRAMLLYRWVRPLMLGFIIAFWAAPTMTAVRLLLQL